MAGQKRKGSGQDSDAQFMRIALRLAERMLGRTAPNPAVGAIIVDPDSGELIARGWTINVHRDKHGTMTALLKPFRQLA